MNKTFVLSGGTAVNSHGFRLELSGLNLERFRANPVMLFGHDRSQVIGKWDNIRTDGVRLLAEADFDTGDELGKKIARKVEKGYLKGASLGLRILKMSDSDDGTVVTASELLEASIVSVPSDALAVALYDANDKPTTLEAVKLEFNFNKNKKMEKKDNEELAARDAKIAELTAQIASFQEAGARELVDRAVAEKKIGADEKETYLSLAKKDFEGVKTILSKMQGVTPVVTQLETTGTAGKYAEKSWDDLDRAEKLVALKAEDPALYLRLYEEKFNVKL
jgi:HK97 family phage prohead protease